ncbi:hypothetical protein KAX17_08395 [Candidatus Bipolaricaulota bacterium]|nr:hypothetical protein [Candidatus Bipolaricaulota bacterium]
MWRRLRSSPSMVVAIVSLVVALLCALYVMERPGTVAIGSPSPSGIRLVTWDHVGPYSRSWWDNARDGVPPQPMKAWNSVEKTVPEGKAWIVIVSPAHTISEVVRGIGHSNLTFPADITARFEYTTENGGRYSAAVLYSGTYHDLDLLIDYMIFRQRGTDVYDMYEGVPAVCLVLEVDSELKESPLPGFAE